MLDAFDDVFRIRLQCDHSGDVDHLHFDDRVNVHRLAVGLKGDVLVDLNTFANDHFTDVVVFDDRDRSRRSELGCTIAAGGSFARSLARRPYVDQFTQTKIALIQA